MDHREMENIIDDVFAQVKHLRETKGKEYATEKDTLADFKEVAAETGITPLQCWATYVKKHQRAIDTFIREGNVKSESIESRIVDVIVYHLILIGLIRDTWTQETPATSARIEPLFCGVTNTFNLDVSGRKITAGELRCELVPDHRDHFHYGRTLGHGYFFANDASIDPLDQEHTETVPDLPEDVG